MVGVARRELGAKHDYTGRFLLDLGQVLSERGRAAEAERALLEAQQVLLAAVGPSHPFVKEAAESLAVFYERAGAAAKARGGRAAPSPMPARAASPPS
jgi:hypothetical protein